MVPEEQPDLIAATKLISMIDGILNSKPPNAQIVERYKTASEANLKLAARASLPYSTALHLKFLLARRKLTRWTSTQKKSRLSESLIELSDALLVLSEDNRISIEKKAAAISAATLFSNLTTKPQWLIRRLNVKRSAIEGVTTAPWVEVLFVEEDDVRDIATNLRLVLHPTPLMKLTQLKAAEIPTSESTASLLLRGSQQKHASTSARSIKPVSDMSQSKVRITNVKLSNFRGVGTEVTINLKRGERPVSALIYGDNGVGKSSLVDGLEFALQGRVGRSHDFNSSFAPLLTNLAANSETVALVNLSDGASIERKLIRTPEGRIKAVGAPTSPGFRWAPVTLKRSDILRFLESDPLSRGTAFFDYFPGDAEIMGTRPEEELVTLEDKQFSLKVRRQTLSIDLAERLGVPQDAVASADALGRTISEKLFGGADIEDAAANGSWDAVDQDLKSLIASLRRTMSEYSRIRKTIERGFNILNPKAYEKEAAQLRLAAEEVGAELTTSFLKVTKADYVKGINVLAGETGPVSLDIVIELKNGQKVFPQQIFSEGYRDLLALLFFLAVAHTSTRRGQAKVLVLDDVIQSVDAGVRLGLMAHVLDRFSDWQLIVTLHDRMWYQQLRALMHKRGHQLVEHRLAGWTFSDGPQLSDSTPRVLAGIEAALASADAALTSGAAGRLLEQIASEESWRFRISIHRTRDDKYTLNDLWPGLVKALKKSPISELMKEIDDASELRNLLGAHYNDYAESASWDEVRNFAQNVKRLAEHLHCPECDDWLSVSENVAVCPCGHTSLQIKQQ